MSAIASGVGSSMGELLRLNSNFGGLGGGFAGVGHGTEIAGIATHPFGEFPRDEVLGDDYEHFETVVGLGRLPGRPRWPVRAVAGRGCRCGR